MWKARRIFDFSFYLVSKSFNVKTKIRTYINYFLICFLSCFGGAVYGQSMVPNPSFEDEPIDATTPVGWYPCAPATTPDILPGYWGVYNEPSDGDSFVGLITRQDGSHESIAAAFDKPLYKGSCYKTSIDLAHSKTYAGFNKALSIRVWLGTEKCQKKQMIYKSPLITHPEWQTYEIKFTAEMEAKYILIEAFFREGHFTHKANILLDNLTTIRLCEGA